MNAYTADLLFTGEEWLPHHGLLVENGKIKAVLPAGEIPETIHRTDFPGKKIVPAFIDLQIYGAGGKLFSVFPQPDTLDTLYQHCISGGTAWCMPTIATNTYEIFRECIDAVRAYWRAGGKGILGLHLEGPWINPIRKGAHLASLIRSPSPGEVNNILSYGEGVVKMVTLAPEYCEPGIIGLIKERGIFVSAGHSDASYAQAKQSFTEGVNTVTHLYNAMSPLQHRAPGLVGATMDDDKVMAGIIPDGYHVDFAAIRIAKAVMKERLFVITDAVTETNSGPYHHHLSGDRYTADGILSGSALTMNRAVQQLTRFAGISLGEALRMCATYPARVIGLQQHLGKLKAGYDSAFTALDEQLEVTVTISE